MFNKSVINRSFVLGNQTIIMMNSDPSWYPFFIVGLFILFGFIIRHAILPALNSDGDELFELSRIQSNHYNTNGSTERGGDVTHDQEQNPTHQF